MRHCSTGVVCLVLALLADACAPASAPPIGLHSGQRPVIAPDPAVFQATVAPRPDEDLAAACRYELTLMTRSRRVQGVWVIFERSRDTLRYYQDAGVRAFAQLHDLALLYPFHCRSKSETGGDMNVDPPKGIGRALFAALTELAQTSGHSELAAAKLILLGFSGTGSLVGRLTGFAPDRVAAVIATNPGHFDPLGMDTISLSSRALAIPQLILAGSTDAVSGTQRPYEYFRRHFDQGAPWTFLVQNKVPHCCVMNAKALILDWLDAVVVQRATRTTGWYGFIETGPSEAMDCPDQSPPLRSSWCHSPRDTWGGQNWSVNTAALERRPTARPAMMPAGWLPTERFARNWLSFVTQPEHPVTMPP